jgi:small subunit ribosomal protein S1
MGVVKNITSTAPSWISAASTGLLHITDMSWGRINHPNEVVNVGDEVKVIVLKFDREQERVSLGYKQLKADPWTTATIKYPTGVRVKGKVVSLTDYGAFVELEEGVEGLIHVSEMSWSKKVKHPSKVLTVGQEVECVVLGLDQEAHRISLGLKQTEANPWEQLVSKYPVGSKIEGKVRNLTEFGAFVEVEEGIDGLIHISDLSWTKRVKHPSEILKKGDTVEAIVLNIDAENQRLSLGLKQLATDIWDEFFAHHKVGDLVEGKVVRIDELRRLRRAARGHRRAWSTSPSCDEKRVEKPEDALQGRRHARHEDHQDQRGREEDRALGEGGQAGRGRDDLQSYREQSGERRSTLGDAIRAAQAREESRDPRSSRAREGTRRMTKAELVDELSARART